MVVCGPLGWPASKSEYFFGTGDIFFELFGPLKALSEITTEYDLIKKIFDSLRKIQIPIAIENQLV
jgi:hypothetical protein